MPEIMLETMPNLSKEMILIIFHNFEKIIRMRRPDISGRKNRLMQ